MSMTGLDVFDTTVHKTNTWLNELMQELVWEARPAAYLAMRATLHALRDRLTIEEVAQLGAQLPMLVRGFYDEGWDPSGKPLKIRRKEEFLERITQELRGVDDQVDPESIVCAVFTVLQRHVIDGEIEDVKHILPAPIRSLWPEVDTNAA